MKTEKKRHYGIKIIIVILVVFFTVILLTDFTPVGEKIEKDISAKIIP